MRFQLFCYTSLLLLALALSCSAQSGRPPGRGTPGVTGRSTTPVPSSPSIPSTIFLSGKVVVDDGAPMTDSASVISICRGVKRTEGHTDAHGGFSFEFKSREMPGTGEIMGDSGSEFENSAPNRSNQRDVRDCELEAELAGFRSETIQLSGKVSTFGSSDIGHIVLHRLGVVDGYTVSATSAMAPDKARKAFEKGRNEIRKNDFEKAAELFQKAVEIYPKYALAWLELGRLQVQQKDTNSARHSFQQATQADANFAIPYQEWGQLAARERQWQEALERHQQIGGCQPSAAAGLVPQRRLLLLSGKDRRGRKSRASGTQG